jgi:nucleoid-associated protein YgaU
MPEKEVLDHEEGVGSNRPKSKSAHRDDMVRKARAKGPHFIAEHTVKSGETLSQIAQHYYGSAAQEKWMAIYEANKEVIGDNPSLVRAGQVLKIPALTA